MDLQETIVLRIQREREEAIQLLTTDPEVYKELLTHHWRGTNGSGEPLRDGVQIGSGGSGICGSWMNILSTPLGFLEYWGIYRAKRRSRGHPRWAQPTRARLCLLARPGRLFPPRGTPRCFPSPLDVFWPKKSSKSFTAFGLHMVLISCDVKNMEKTTTTTGHQVNRLVPKIDI